MAKQSPYILGLDLGTTSIGWAMVKLTRSQKRVPEKILKAGVRIFEAGVEGDIEQGKDSSKATKRREARQPRRQNWRTQDRKRKLFLLLQELNLLPPSESAKSIHRMQTLDNLDKELRSKHIPAGDHEAQQKLTYFLRDLAATDQLEPYEIGRAIYALAARRGYLSNRKSQGDDDEKAGVVKASIGELQTEITEMGEGTTLAQYFNRKVNPVSAGGKRIRRRYTHRNMFRDEFDAIQKAQANHLPLSVEDWDRIKGQIFFQRPLKSQKALIGECKLEIGEKRCPECLPIFQQFRILQKVNDLQVMMPDQSKISIKEIQGAREKLIDALQTKARLTANQAAKAADLPKKAKFSLEEHEGLDLIGHRTNVKMIEVFGDRWLELSATERDSITLEVLHYRNGNALVKRAQSAWKVDAEGAARLKNMRLEEEYARHSKKALEKLVAAMQSGTQYSTARQELYPESFEGGEVFEKLPPISEWDNDLGNPAVMRAMTELRKVVNSLVSQYGKPVRIHIEVARDIKNSRKRRKEIHQQNQKNKKARERAAALILSECGIENATRRDIQKWQLADECDWTCPYCGKGFGGNDLVGSNSEFNIEHIYPRKYLDDSYVNKTISCRSCNDHKGDFTPKQAFSGEQYEEILQRVKHFKGSLRDAKLKRFETEQPDEDFVARHLNDTRYNARVAASYLGSLYGGYYDDEGQRIVTPTGGLTWMLRTGWQLNDVLSDSVDVKDRDDHRHHAIDAIIVALSDQSRIQKVAVAASRAQEYEQRKFLDAVEYPWPMFKNDVSFAIQAINVSHRPTRSIAGPLHAESIYSKEHIVGGEPQIRIRKELRKLSVKEIMSDQIVDPAIRKLVQEKFQELGSKNPAQAFAEEENFPKLKNKNGDDIPIRKVRLKMNVTPRSVGKGEKQRNVASGKDSNFASMVYAILDKDGNETKWVHEIITRLEAAERYSGNLKKVDSRGNEKVLISDEQDGKRRFKFALRKNDMLFVDGEDGEPVLYRVQKMSKAEIQLCPHNHGTITNPERTPWNRITSTDKLRQRNATLANVSVVGEIGK